MVVPRPIDAAPVGYFQYWYGYQGNGNGNFKYQGKPNNGQPQPHAAACVHPSLQGVRFLRSEAYPLATTIRLDGVPVTS